MFRNWNRRWSHNWYIVKRRRRWRQANTVAEPITNYRHVDIIGKQPVSHGSDCTLAWCMQSKCLAVRPAPGSHKADFISAALPSIFSEWTIRQSARHRGQWSQYQEGRNAVVEGGNVSTPWSCLWMLASMAEKCLICRKYWRKHGRSSGTFGTVHWHQVSWTRLCSSWIYHPTNWCKTVQLAGIRYALAKYQ